jgi:hypothetical protein
MGTTIEKRLVKDFEDFLGKLKRGDRIEVTRVSRCHCYAEPDEFGAGALSCPDCKGKGFVSTKTTLA